MLMRWIDRHKDALLAFTARLVATPSPNLPGDERAVVAVIQREMDRLALAGATIAAKEPHRPNVIYRLNGARSGPTFMLCGHSDTKPVGDRSQWKTDPFDPVIRDGKLFGLGSTDMKGAVAAMIFAVAALKQCNVKLAGDLLLVINADEERGMTYGSEYLSTEYGLKADIALLGEPSAIDGPEFEYLHLLSRGLSCFKIKVYGTQMHSSLSDRLSSVNANVKMAETLSRLNHQLTLNFNPHSLCAAPTVNLGVKLEGGVGYGVVPGMAEIQSDIRILPGMTRAQVQSDILACLDRIVQADPSIHLSFHFEEPPLDWFEPTEVDLAHPLVGVLTETAFDVLGRRPKLSAFPGATDAKNFQNLAGIPTIPSFGPGWLPLAHGPNECVGVRGVIDAAKIYALAAQRFLA